MEVRGRLGNGESSCTREETSPVSASAGEERGCLWSTGGIGMLAASAQKDGDEMGKEEEGSESFPAGLFSGVGMSHVVEMIWEITIRYGICCRRTVTIDEKCNNARLNE